MEQAPIISHPNKILSRISSGPTSQSPNQRQRIIELLRQNGKAGLLTSDFLRIPIARYSARLRELRQQGYDISTERITESCFKYVLVSEPLAPMELPTFQPRPKATDQEQPPLFAGTAR